MIDITDAEWKVMECLWAKSPKTVRELTEELVEATAWKRHTVISFLNRLMAKGAVLRKEDSAVHEYIPLVSREEAVKSETKTYLGKIKPHSLLQLVSYFSDDENLNREETESLRQLIKHLEEGGE